MTTLAAPHDWAPECEEIARIAAATARYPGAQHDDVLQEARIGVNKALRDYRPVHGIPFRPFALMCAKRQVITGLVTATRAKHELVNRAASLSAPPPSKPDAKACLGDLMFRDGDDPCRIVIARDEARRLLRRMQLLTALERECVTRCMIAGEPYEAVGDPKRVDNALQRARRKLAEDTAAPEPLRRRHVLVDRTVHPTPEAAAREALRVAGGGTVVHLAKRKLLDGRDRAPQGRPTTDGRLGQPVWRVELAA